MADMIPISDASVAQLRRFPYKERLIAQQVLRKEVLDKVDITADSIVCASLIVLIEEFGFGTKTSDKSRILRYIKSLQELLDLSADYYDEAMAEGLRLRLHRLGVDYERKEK